jgi:protein O-GlcNAc transferase
MTLKKSHSPVKKSNYLKNKIAQLEQFYRQQQLPEASLLCNELLHNFPNDPDVLFHASRVVVQGKAIYDGLKLIQKAISINNKDPLYYQLLARILTLLDCYPDALTAIEQSLLLDPKNIHYLDAKAAILIHLSKVDEGISLLKNVIELAPNYMQSYQRLYNIYINRNQIEEAELLCNKALTLENNKGLLLYFFTIPPKILNNSEDIDRLRARIFHHMSLLRASSFPFLYPSNHASHPFFFLAYHNRNNKKLLSQLSDLYRYIYPALNYIAPHCETNHVRRPGKKRIAIITAYWSMKHPVMKCYAQLVEALLHHPNYEVTLLNMAQADEETDDLWPKANHYATTHLPIHFSQTTISMLSEPQFDLMLYLDIGMNMQSYFLAHSRFAPIQLCLGGHPITTGISTVDYYASSKLFEPENAQDHYREQLITSDGMILFQDTPPRPMSTPCSRDDFGWPNNVTLYALPCMLHKFHPDIDQLIAKLAARDPNSMILLFYREPISLKHFFHQRITGHFPELEDRLIYTPWLAENQFCNALALCDAVLDSIYFGLGSTLMFTFPAGLPIITLEGDFLHGRFASGMYQWLGIEGLSAKTKEEYVEKAYHLAHNPEFRKQKSDEIRAKSARLFDTKEHLGHFLTILDSLLG